jgi:hypothetical protein
MGISLASIRRMVVGSAGLGGLLVAGFPAAWADDSQFPSEATPAISSMDSSPYTPYATGHSEMWGQTGRYSAVPPSERIGKPGFAVLPPPGTLTQTYLRQSWPIPKDEHPRTAIIQISAPGFTEIEIEGLADLEGFQRPDGAWIFKTEKPLIPGNPHIYHVKAGHKNNDDRWEVRTVRLIPGRVVTLDY